jgi:hypothetical protein
VSRYDEGVRAAQRDLDKMLAAHRDAGREGVVEPMTWAGRRLVELTNRDGAGMIVISPQFLMEQLLDVERQAAQRALDDVRRTIGVWAIWRPSPSSDESPIAVALRTRDTIVGGLRSALQDRGADREDVTK